MQKRGPLAEDTAAASFLWAATAEQLVAVMEILWMTRWEGERILLADGPANPCPAWDLERRNYAKREVNSIDAPSKPKVDVQESIANAKAYCKQNPESFVSLRDYSGGIYNETCAAFAAEQHAADPTYKIGSD